MDHDKGKIIKSGLRIFNIAEIINCLLRDVHETSYKKSRDEEQYVGRPSDYIKQLSMATEERTQYIIKWSNRLNLPFCTRFEGCNFEVNPTIVIFQQFAAGSSLSVIVTIRNSTSIPKYLRSSNEPDPFFSVEACGCNYSMMVAPGLSVMYRVKFTPEMTRDYHYELKFTTDSGEFTVPVIAIGPRGMLDFPDKIEVPLTAVKIPSLKTLFVRNVGNASTTFTVYTDNACFWIEPAKGTIEEEETLQFTVYFLSRKAGEFEANLFLEYDTGEKLRVKVRGSAENCPIRIDRGTVRMEDTFLGLSRSKTITIHNRSNFIVKYKWMQYESAEVDNERRELYKTLYHSAYEYEVPRCVDFEHYNVCTPDIHQLVYQRIYADELESLTNQTFHYNHICFMFTPEESEIWPQSSTEVVVLFRALEMGELCSTAYLEVTGREDRIPLTLYGTGKGPVLQLNVLTINLENIYMCSTHNYEVIAVNKSHIPGTLVYRAKATDFGGTLDVTPRSLHLCPGEHKSFNLSFSSNRKGDFVERVDFVVKESLEVLSLHIKGCITCPTLHFDKESLDFGTTALGFRTRQDVYLHNLALIPVAYTITVLEDGDQRPLGHEDFARAQTKPGFPSNPREFQIIPEEGVVVGGGAQRIKVIYTANIARAGQTTIQVDMWDTDTNPVTLPVKFCGSVASLSIVPSEIAIRFCFVNFPYSRSFAVENKSDLDAYFYLVPQQVSEDSEVVCSLSKYQGYVKPRQSRTIDVSIITRVLGNQRVCLNMLTMGEQSPALSSVIITCNGQGAVVSVEPNSLNFGDVKLLEEKTMELQVINDSPIPTQFTAAMSKPNSPWSVSPRSGDLEPQGSMPITVKVFLVDVGKYKENLVLSVINSRSISVELRVTGYGCSVVFEPQIFPTFDWGLLFSHQEIERTITMTNRGTRQYQMIFSNEPEIRFYRGQVTMSETTKFQIHPRMVEISPGTTKQVFCKLFWKKNESLFEDWYVFGQMQGGGKRERVDKSSFTITLTEPQILFSRRELTFRVDICPAGDKLQQIDELLVTNQSKLDLNVQLSVKPPFCLITSAEEHVQKMNVVLIDGATTKIRVFFSIDYGTANRYSKRYIGLLRLEYQEHPNQDKITCKGYVNFPNINIEPRNIVIDCELGSSAEKVLTLTNDGPVSVVYKFQWLADTIEIERDTTTELECGCLPEEEKLKVGTPEIHEDSVETEMNEEICMNNDVQDGSGDGPLKTIPPPVNCNYTATNVPHRISLGNSVAAPVSETHRHKPELLDENIGTNGYQVSNQEIRELLMSIIGSYFKKDEDLVVLESLRPDPPKNYFINEVLQIVPNEGTVLPYTVQRVHVGFHGFERLQIKARIVCEVLRGPTELVNLLARADAVRFETDTNIIDFGQQMFLELNRKSFVLRNRCGIAFEYKIITTDLLIDEAADQFDLQPLKVEPNCGFVEPEGIVEFHVDHLPTVLGSIDHQIYLQISHLMPVTIKVEAYSTFPQVYLSIPRGKPPQYYSVELEYFAIQWLTDDYLLNVNKPDGRKWDDLLVTDLAILEAEGWCIIPSEEETFLRVIDIDMAVERHLARKFVDANSYILMQRYATRKNEPIPQLFSFEYIIDMRYVIVECTAHYSTNLINYGPWSTTMRMRTIDKKNFLEKSGITVEFKKHSKLLVGDSAVLQVTWNPTRDRFTEKSTEVKHTIHIEVANGCTIPVTIKGIVTYPNVSMNTKFLDFQDVVVGECLVLCFLIKNE
ncbi:hydrocephalus-inducing protein homolog [Ceratina calcarata]|uniref:Hydrocephalus-inducing protein homolog n=1 Tax=Ceratina calcarata TaxID=156304 RepID=A0AAJ7WBC0_9HYME|nr:hydrocephalus-inducing protein homolog [Ceratina calcarata]